MNKNLKIFLNLIKSRLTLMVTISALVGYILAPAKFEFINFVWLFIGVYLLSGGACGINQWQEKDIDARMSRTSKRPIPAGQIKPGAALFISLFMVFLGFQVLFLNGQLPALLGVANIVFYNLFYTPLKTKSPLSIIPGAVVGAVPPMIGWTSAGGDILHPNILFIAIFMFSWQLPHFWLLLIMYGKEYEKAGFSSISKYLNQKQIKYLVFFWTVLTSLFIFLYPVFNIYGSTFLFAILVLLNIGFIFLFYRLLFGETRAKSIKQAFIAINSFMLLVLLIFITNLLV